MKGKIAVIDSCFRCPYRAFDNTMGIIFNKNKMKEHNSEIAYCGYHKIGYNGLQIRIEKYYDNITIPKNCPLPLGNDGRNLKK